MAGEAEASLIRQIERVVLRMRAIAAVSLRFGMAHPGAILGISGVCWDTGLRSNAVRIAQYWDASWVNASVASVTIHRAESVLIR